MAKTHLTPVRRTVEHAGCTSSCRAKGRGCRYANDSAEGIRRSRGSRLPRLANSELPRIGTIAPPTLGGRLRLVPREEPGRSLFVLARELRSLPVGIRPVSKGERS